MLWWLWPKVEEVIRKATGRQGSLTLSRYVETRNGVQLVAAGSLRSMFHGSLGACSFAGFSRHWTAIYWVLPGPVRQLAAEAIPSCRPRRWSSRSSCAVRYTTQPSCWSPDRSDSASLPGSPCLVRAFWSRVGLDYRSRAWAFRASVNIGLVLSGLGVALLAKGYSESHEHRSPRL